MTFKDYIEQKSGHTLKEMAELLKDQVSYQTLKGVARGMKMSLYPKAKAVSDATRPTPDSDPLVTVSELCE